MGKRIEHLNETVEVPASDDLSLPNVTFGSRSRIPLRHLWLSGSRQSEVSAPIAI
jgi:hypothetical protein